MKLKITFVNPNTEKDVDKHLPGILAEAVISKVTREIHERDFIEQYDVRHSA